MSEEEGSPEEGTDASASGEPEKLLGLLYDELRRLARSRLREGGANASIQATELVHEAYLRLLGPQGRDAKSWNGRGHFFGAAAKAMRQILVDRARARGALKRGGDRVRLDLDWASIELDRVPPEIVELDAALERLAAADPLKAELVSLRFFAGLSQREAAAALGISMTTADRHWAFARAWLLTAMDGDV